MIRLPEAVPRSDRRARTRFPARAGSRVAALAAAVLALAGCGSQASSGSSPLPALHADRPGPVTMLTTPTVGDLTPANLQLIKSLGVDEVQIYMHWADIAPNPGSRTRPSFDAASPAAYPASGWAPYDTAIRELAALHLGMDLALVPPPPLWAQGRGAPRGRTPHPQWKPDVRWYGQWVAAVGTRYSGHYTPPGQTAPLPRVHFWSIWNEPNLGLDLAPQTTQHGALEVSPRYYRALLGSAWSALRATGHAGDRILIGELAPAGMTRGNGPGNFGMMPGLRFLRALYCVDASFAPLTGAAATERGCPATAAGSARFRADNPALFEASGFADHPYQFGLRPDQLAPGEPDYTNLAAIPALERTLDRLQQVYGSTRRFPIWSTEFGYLTTPPNPPGGVAPQVAAYYLNWSEYLTWLDPRIRSYDQYELQDPASGRFASGLETAAGAPKPALYAFRMPIYLPVTATASGHPLLVWGGARAAPLAAATTHRSQSVAIQFSPRASAPFRTLRTVSIVSRHGYFETLQRFPASGRVRLAWTPPQGATQYSRIVSITLH